MSRHYHAIARPTPDAPARTKAIDKTFEGIRDAQLHLFHSLPLTLGEIADLYDLRTVIVKGHHAIQIMECDQSACPTPEKMWWPANTEQGYER